MSETPIARVSASKYDRPARVRVRLKGETDGPVYEGQRVVVPCKTCGQRKQVD